MPRLFDSERIRQQDIHPDDIDGERRRDGIRSMVPGRLTDAAMVLEKSFSPLVGEFFQRLPVGL